MPARAVSAGATAGHGAPADRLRWLEIDLGAVAHNTRAIRNLIGPVPRFYASLKADGYGHGLEAIARTAVVSGADAIAVGGPEDALRIRAIGLTEPVLAYHAGVPSRDVVRELEREKISVTVVDEASAKAYAAGAQGSLGVFVKVDAGLHRMGVVPDKALDLVDVVNRQPRLRLEGIYTHMHAPGDASIEYLRWQFRRFTVVVERARAAGLPIETAMAASSGVLVHGAEMVLDAVEPGRLLYGLGITDASRQVLPLRPAFVALKTRLVQVKPVRQRDDYVDVAPFRIGPDMRIGVVPMGRWHGLDRATTGSVLVRGRHAPVLGPISIEHCRLDLTGIPDAAVGDEVVVIGTQGSETITLEDVAAATHAIATLDVTLATGARVARIYIGGEAEAGPG
jgi:alanine racemase